MKKLNSYLIGAIIITFLFILIALGGYSDTHYDTIAQVFVTDDTGTIFIDGAGYLWSVSDTDYTTKETVRLYFYNNGTDYTRNDDEIVKIKREKND